MQCPIFGANSRNSRGNSRGELGWLGKSPLGPDFGSLLGSNFELAFEWIREPLGLDFGSLLGFQIEVKNDLKIRSVKIAKFDSRLGGS